MNTICNLPKYNLDNLINLKTNDNLKIKNNNILEVDKFKFYNYFLEKKPYSVNYINNILNQSFFHHLNIFEITYFDNLECNEKDFNENKNNLISYLEKCIISLEILIKTNNNNIILLELKKKFENELDKFKKLDFEMFKEKKLKLKKNDHFYNNITYDYYYYDFDNEKFEKEIPFYQKIYNYIFIKLYNILEFISRINF